jgi:hypothetical protein
MPDPPDTSPPAIAWRPPPLPLWKLALGFLAVFVIALLADRLLGEWSSLAIAVAFLYLPLWLVGRAGDPVARYGLTLDGWRRGLLAFVLTAALVFPLYSVGFSFVQRVLFDARPELEAARFTRWPAELDGPVRADGIVLKTSTSDRLELHNRTAKPQRLCLSSASGPVVVSGSGVLESLRDGAELRVVLRPGGTAWVKERRATRVASCPRDGRPPSELLDPDGEALGPVADLTPGSWWWVTFALWHVVMVALTEEFFFRGFLQTELNRRMRRRVRFMGADLGWSLLIVSALFALGHLATSLHPARLLVFFPSLVMGYLRERTGNLLASILFHGASNILMELLLRLHYG